MTIQLLNAPSPLEKRLDYDALVVWVRWKLKKLDEQPRSNIHPGVYVDILEPHAAKVWGRGFLHGMNVVKDFMSKAPGTLIRIQSTVERNNCAIAMMMGLVDPLQMVSPRWMTRIRCIYTTSNDVFPLGPWEIDALAVLELLDTNEVRVIYECERVQV